MRQLNENELRILGAYLEEEMFHSGTTRLGKERGDYTPIESFGDEIYDGTCDHNWRAVANAYDPYADDEDFFHPHPGCRVCCKLVSMYLRGNEHFNQDMQKASEYLDIALASYHKVNETMFAIYIRILFDLGLTEGVEANYGSVLQTMHRFRFFYAIPQSLGGARLQLFTLKQVIRFYVERGAIATAKDYVEMFRIFAKRYVRRFNTSIYDELLQEESFTDVDALYERRPRFVSK